MGRWPTEEHQQTLDVYLVQEEYEQFMQLRFGYKGNVIPNYLIIATLLHL